MTTDKTPERMLSSDDLADRWQVSTRTIKRMTDRREIHFIRIGKQMRFMLSDVLAYERKWRS